MGDSEFWLLLLVYIQHILAKQKTVNPNFDAVEQQIVPLLDRFNFLSECNDLRALSGIIDSLKADEYVLPFDTRKQLCRRLLHKATNANTVKEAQGLVDYAKQIVDCDVNALREANQGLGFHKGCNENMIYVVEERICSAIIDEDILLQEGKLQKVDQALYVFFNEYSGEKKLHQDEICNTLVYMCLQKIEEGVVCVDTIKNQIEDNPLKAREASDLHLALNFGLSLCSDALDAVVDSLILNINEDFGIPVLDKAKCVQWFL